MFDLKLALQLCLIIGFSETNEENMLLIVQQAISGGITSVQLRDKYADEQTVARVGALLLKILPPHIPLIINDYVDVAHYLQTALHIGQTDREYSLARKQLGSKAIIGLSIENITQAEQCKNLDVDYYGIGPVFATQSKLDAGPPIGIEGLIAIHSLLAPKPCIAIGGINSHNIADISKTGITGTAVISAITYAEQPYSATKQLLENWNKHG